MANDGLRIAIIGTSGVGKTTLARRLSGRLDIPHIELDALHWKPNWEPAPDEEFRERVGEATAASSWISDGNYKVVRELVWGRATHVVWLDYPFPLILGRLLVRTFRRGIWREPLYNGNRESLWTAFFDRESVLLWAIQSHPRNQREFSERLRSQLTDRTVLRLRRPREAECLVETLEGLLPPT